MPIEDGVWKQEHKFINIKIGAQMLLYRVQIWTWLWKRLWLIRVVLDKVIVGHQSPQECR